LEEQEIGSRLRLSWIGGENVQFEIKVRNAGKDGRRLFGDALVRYDQLPGFRAQFPRSLAEGHGLLPLTHFGAIRWFFVARNHNALHVLCSG
jgi:hypothetical protein